MNSFRRRKNQSSKREYYSQNLEHKGICNMKFKKPFSGLKLEAQCPFSTTITITLSEHPYTLYVPRHRNAVPTEEITKSFSFWGQWLRPDVKKGTLYQLVIFLLSYFAKLLIRCFTSDCME